MSAWVKCSERMPKPDGLRACRATLIWCPDRRNTYCANWYAQEQQWYIFGGTTDKVCERVTHWQPLPAPPE